MREIKFRVWHDNLKNFVYVEKCDYLGSTGIIDYHLDCYFGIWEQFTGLTDKNGKKIYEGDIVNVRGMIPPKLNGTGYVYWNTEGAYFAVKTFLPFLLHKAYEIEVVGNIHDKE